MSITEHYLNKQPVVDPPDYDLDYYQDLLSQDSYYEEWLNLVEDQNDNRTT